MTVDEEGPDRAAIAGGVASIAAADAFLDDIASAGLGSLEIHRRCLYGNTYGLLSRPTALLW